MTHAKAPSGLTKYVGYREIRDAFGISTRTIQDMVRKNEFPQPVRLPGRVGGPVSFRLQDVIEWDELRRTHQRTHLRQLAVADPSRLKPEQLADALANFGARHASALAGREVSPSEIGLTYPLSSAERAVIAEAAAAQQQAAINDLIDRLDGIHTIEALILMRAFLKPLRNTAEQALLQLGVPITMSDLEWREAAVLICERLWNGETIPAQTMPRDAADVLVDGGVLKRNPPAAGPPKK